MARGVISGRLYVVGGMNASNRYATGWYYDPVANAFTAIATAPTVRAVACGAVHGGKLYVFGGETSGPTTSAVVEEYNPTTNAWTAKTALPAARSSAGAATIGSYIYIVGGLSGTTTTTQTATIYRYDPITDTMATMTSMATARYAPAVEVYGGKLYIVGGRANGNGLTSVEIYDPATNACTAGTAIPSSGRGNAGFGLIDGSYLHLAGGWETGPVAVHHRYNFGPAPLGWLAAG